MFKRVGLMYLVITAVKIHATTMQSITPALMITSMITNMITNSVCVSMIESLVTKVIVVTVTTNFSFRFT